MTCRRIGSRRQPGIRESLIRNRMRAGHGGSNAHNLRQVERVIPNGVEDQVLQFIDGHQQILAQGRHLEDEWNGATPGKSTRVKVDAGRKRPSRFID